MRGEGNYIRVLAAGVEVGGAGTSLQALAADARCTVEAIGTGTGLAAGA